MESGTTLVRSSQLGWQLYEEGRLEEAAATLPTEDTALDQEALELLGLIRHDQGRSGEGLDLFEQAEKLGPLGDRAKIALACCHAACGKQDIAREQFLRLAISRTLPPDRMLEVAAGLASIDAVQMAIQTCQWAIDRDQTNAQAYFDMGKYSAQLGQPAYVCEALAQRALQLSPENVHFRVGLASLLIELNQPSEAIKMAHTLRPDQIESATCASCLSNIAGLLREYGQEEMAVLCERRASELFETKRNALRQFATTEGA
ncbi:MAG: tetratricopeptide repeat protein [Planctomycetota bacterium]